MAEYVRNIVEFHQHFRHDFPELPVLEPEMVEFRLKFLQEELDEIRNAYHEDNLADFLDGLVDLVYVAIGTAYVTGLPFHSAWMAVHDANMRKQRADHPDQSKRGSAYDVIKPSGWQPPDIEGILKDYIEWRKASSLSTDPTPVEKPPSPNE